MTRPAQPGPGPAPAGPLFLMLRLWLARLDRVSHGAVVAAMALMTALVIVQVVFRYFLSASIDWSEELARLAFVWAMFLAIPHGIRSGVHVGIDALITRFSPAVQGVAFRISAALGAVLMVFVLVFSARVTAYTWPETMPTVGLTAASYYIAVLIAAGHSILHLILLGWGGPATWPAEHAE